MYIFATVGVATTSGFDYANQLYADGSMTWTGESASHSGQSQIAAILDPAQVTHVFVRHADRAPFVYLGPRTRAQLEGERPAKMMLFFGGHSERARSPSARTFTEGAEREVRQTLRERDPEARKACLEHWGSACVVCGLDAPWNHVHHLYPVTEGERDVNPITDLRPLCPSCHAAVHWFRPLLSIDEARHLPELASSGGGG